jgi:hypothetical protein
MRILKIHVDKTITEHDLETDQWMSEEISWDCCNVDSEHDIWFDDNSIENPNSTHCFIKTHHIPLPAYVTGFSEETTIGAKMSVDELYRLIR